MTLPSQVDVVPPARRGRAGPWRAGGGRRVESIGAVRGPGVILVDVPQDAAAVQEETFGPDPDRDQVSDVEEAVRLANGTRYGLGAAVFSKGRGEAIARRLRGGMASVNAVVAYAGWPGCRSAGSATPVSAGSTARTGCASSPGRRRSPGSGSRRRST